MAANLNSQVALRLADRGISLLRLSASEWRRVQPILRQIERDATMRLLDAGLSATSRSALTSVLSDVRLLSQRGFAAAAAEMQLFMADLILAESAFVAGALNSTIGVAVVSALSPSSTLRVLASDRLIQGAPSADWWARQASDFAFRFAQQMRLGIAAGESNSQLIARFKGTGDYPSLMAPTYRSAEALVRTSVQTVAHAARLETFQANDDIIKGVQQQSTLDSRTSDICIAYDGQSWDLDGDPIDGSTLPFDGGPPRHWNCRSVLVPIVKSWKELGSESDLPRFSASTRASMDGEVAATTSFENWFDSRSVTQQNEILGAGRAELFRSGKITLQELLDQRGRPLTLEQLERRHGKAA